MKDLVRDLGLLAAELLVVRGEDAVKVLEVPCPVAEAVDDVEGFDGCVGKGGERLCLEGGIGGEGEGRTNQ